MCACVCARVCLCVHVHVSAHHVYVLAHVFVYVCVPERAGFNLLVDFDRFSWDLSKAAPPAQTILRGGDTL